MMDAADTMRPVPTVARCLENGKILLMLHHHHCEAMRSIGMIISWLESIALLQADCETTRKAEEFFQSPARYRHCYGGLSEKEVANEFTTLTPDSPTFLHYAWGTSSTYEETQLSMPKQPTLYGRGCCRTWTSEIKFRK